MADRQGMVGVPCSSFRKGCPLHALRTTQDIQDPPLVLDALGFRKKNYSTL